MISETSVAIVTLIFTLILRTVSILQKVNQSRLHHTARGENSDVKLGTKRTNPATTLVVLGSGGHTTEMISLLSGLNPKLYTPLIHVIATTDSTSEHRVLQYQRDCANHTRMPDVVYRIPRSREVGQSYMTSIFTTLHAFLYSVRIIYEVKPDLILCNGPGTCLPVVVSAFLARILGLGGEGKVIFAESFCRVQNLSLTGKLLYPIVDRFIVHWEELHMKYPKSDLVQTFVRREKLI